MFRMSIYAHPHVRASGSYFGYAYTYDEIQRHLQRYTNNGENLRLDLNSPKAGVQLYYGSPHGFFYPHQYKIQMTQWESTLVPPNWVEHAKEYDEWWTANQFGADAFINAGVPAEKIHVFEHGVDSAVWWPHKRERGDVLRFLHVDSGSPRKRADLAIKAFKKAFGNNPKYELTLKHSHYNHSAANWKDKAVLATRGEWHSSNIRHIKENMSLEDLKALYDFHDVLVYPSEGEGFGLIPLQALATGMPVISTGRWCSYERYLNGNVIESSLGESEIIETYTRFGEVVLPDVDSLIKLMKHVADTFDEQAEVFYSQIPQVVADYDWQTLTNKAMDSLIDRIGRDRFENTLEYLTYKDADNEA